MIGENWNVFGIGNIGTISGRLFKSFGFGESPWIFGSAIVDYGSNYIVSCLLGENSHFDYFWLLILLVYISIGSNIYSFDAFIDTLH